MNRRVRVAAVGLITLLAVAFVYKEVFIDTARAETELASLRAEFIEYPAPQTADLVRTSTLARPRQAMLQAVYMTRLTQSDVESHYGSLLTAHGYRHIGERSLQSGRRVCYARSAERWAKIDFQQIGGQLEFNVVFNWEARLVAGDRLPSC